MKEQRATVKGMTDFLPSPYSCPGRFNFGLHSQTTLNLRVSQMPAEPS